jgi:hypothetical protein
MIDSDFCNCHLGDDSNPKPNEGQTLGTLQTPPRVMVHWHRAPF